MPGQKKNYEVLDRPTAGGKESYGEEPPCWACDRKRCLNGRCGVCWLVVLGLGIAVGICAILIFAGVLGFGFETDGTDTLYREICTTCTDEPTSNPTSVPTGDPTSNPSATPTMMPTADPTVDPTSGPTANPTGTPTLEPTNTPTVEPTNAPTGSPTVEPTNIPTGAPTVEPTSVPTVPTAEPTVVPTDAPTLEPTSEPTVPTNEPTEEPTVEPTAGPTNEPTVEPTADPTVPTNEPTSAPTSEITSEPTSERRLMFNPETTPKILLVVSDSKGFDDTHVGTSKLDDFLKESYTFNNVQSQLTWGKLMTGKMTPIQTVDSHEAHLPINSAKLVEKLITKGYKNYYYGNWMWDSTIDSWNFLSRGWDLSNGTVDHFNSVTEAIQSTLQLQGDALWYMTVGLTKPELDAEFGTQKMKPDVYEDCARYFLVGSTDFNYVRGVSCQWSMKNDEIFGQVLEIIKATQQWEHTVVVLVITGEEEELMFSIGGGALPAELLSRTNEDPHNFLDIAPTILSIAGFTDSELAIENLDGVDLMNEDSAIL